MSIYGHSQHSLYITVANITYTSYSEYYYDGAIYLSGKDDTSYYLAITNSIH